MFDNIHFIYFNLKLFNGSGWPEGSEGAKRVNRTSPKISYDFWVASWLAGPGQIDPLILKGKIRPGRMELLLVLLQLLL